MRIVQHPNGAWRDQADFLLYLDPPEGDVREQIWARHLDGNRYAVCCIPFFHREIALGDVVEAKDFVVGAVLEGSGRWTMRIFFEREARAREIIDELTNAGCLVELHGKLVAIDAKDRRLRDWAVDRLKQYDWEGVLRLDYV